MLTESILRNPVLINTIGHTTGVLLFGLIIALLVRDRRAHGIRETKLSLIAAALAFAWNVGSLISVAANNPDSLTMQVIMTASFAVLSLLPAVLLQVVLRGQFPSIARAGYAISGAAVLLHVWELFVTSPEPHQIALLLVAIGFAVLIVVAVALKRTMRKVSPVERSDWISLGCLILFSSSLPHFGYQHSRSPWSAEIAWHHIGIPVALVVLLQDYRFLLLDTFVRFLMNSGLAATYVACLLFLNQRFHLWKAIGSSVFLTGIALVALCLSLILFAHLRNLLQQLIGRFIFHRQDLGDRIRAIANLSAQTKTEEQLVSDAAREVAAHFRTARFAVVSEVGAREETDRPAMLLGTGSDGGNGDLSWAEAQIPLRFSSGEIRFLLTGTRRGRQRYLSEDLDDMRRLGAVIVEQVERFRSEELRRLAAQAELRALQAQINPHFLFNAFNTLYGSIDRASFEARRLVLNLTEIFRYFLQGNRSTIALSEELRIVKAYLEIEALRLGDRLTSELDIGESALPVMIPILSIQPLVENAVKHGVAAKAGPGRVVVRAHKNHDSLRITVEDSSLGAAGIGATPHDGSGMGLANVRRRLFLTYGPESTLDALYSAQGSTVTLVIPAMMASLVEIEEAQIAG
ncbi:MAG: histidine kinase [Bryobacteraceae bacterium]